MEQTTTDVYTPDQILTAIRHDAEQLAVTADSAKTPFGGPPDPETLNRVIRVLDDAGLVMQYHRLLLETQINPDRPLDDAELERMMPVLVAAFRVRLGEDRAEPIDAAMAEQRYRRAAWRLCSTVRDHEICLWAGDRRMLARLWACIDGSQDPRRRDTQEPRD